jgi:hypothetical protein
MKVVKRLADLGFSPGAALEAYVMAGRNEEIAASMLFENQHRGFNPSVVVNEGFEFIDPTVLSPAVSEEGPTPAMFNREVDDEEDFYGDSSSAAIPGATGSAPMFVPDEEDFYSD